MLTFSVIIPTYGRLDELRKCLDTLVAVDPPDGGFEVVTVDDGTPGLWISYLHASARRHWRLLGN
jgi:glycosyltransferase involved in cell wall biosynthesis